jgi:hypothetical protein
MSIHQPNPNQSWMLVPLHNCTFKYTCQSFFMTQPISLPLTPIWHHLKPKTYKIILDVSRNPCNISMWTNKHFIKNRCKLRCIWIMGFFTLERLESLLSPAIATRITHNDWYKYIKKYTSSVSFFEFCIIYNLISAHKIIKTHKINLNDDPSWFILFVASFQN